MEPAPVKNALRLLPAALLAAKAAFAAGPETAPMPPPITTPQDKPYPGRITLAVDATDLDHHVFHVHETIPVTAGPLTLLYPKWIPGNHSPTGPIPALDGLVIKAGSTRLDWQRDTVDVFAFHVQIPQGATSIDADFDYLSAPDEREGRVEMTGTMLDLPWNTQLLYPAGYYARDIEFAPSVALPAGWQFGTALESASQSGAHANFKPVTLDVLMDSPLLAGQYFSRIDLDPAGKVPVHLDVTADRPEDLVIKPADLAAHRNLVQQAYRTFGSHHYNHYDFLFSLSDELGGEGLEHHRSSEDGTDRIYFTDPEKSAPERDLLAHEFTHSWNGKFRRPADLFSPDFNVIPERDSLLWVYEGQTQYWGNVLASRAGMLNAAQVRDSLAMIAASLANTAGRTWRDLQDTTNDPIINRRRPLAWPNFQRHEDYYNEGLLIWLDADTLIREKSNNTRSLNDFARHFFGIKDGDWGVVTYNFNDVVAALNDVQPYDWTNFLRTRLDTNGPGAPLDGITRGGWRLVYTAEPSAMQKAREHLRKMTSFDYSLGLTLGREGAVTNVQWDSPAYHAGLAIGVKLIAVNGLAFDDAGDLATAITAAKTTQTPIELLIRDGKHFRTVKIDYHSGLRYPHLERMKDTPDRLDDILAAIK